MPNRSDAPRRETGEDPRTADRLARGFSALVGLTLVLIVLGAVVRAHGAGLACPDWPLCFGELIPEMNLLVGLEWTHRVFAASVALGFAVLAVFAMRHPSTRRATSAPLALAAGLLAAQVLFGALTVWHLLAAWSVTSHLLMGNAFAVTLVWIASALREQAHGAPARLPVSAAARGWVSGAAVLLVMQVVLGGLVSSRFAGPVCPDWPACSEGVWFPSWKGVVGIHLMHRMTGYSLLGALCGAAFTGRSDPRLRSLTTLSLALGVAQLGVGIANVLLGVPLEVTGLHTALAAALALALFQAGREVWIGARAAPSRAG